jgi:hypothetical protein
MRSNRSIKDAVEERAATRDRKPQKAAAKPNILQL